MVILAVDASGVGGVIGRSLWRLHVWCIGWMLDWTIASLHHAHADLFIAAVQKKKAVGHWYTLKVHDVQPDH